jgi:hypothetical protein
LFGGHRWRGCELFRGNGEEGVLEIVDAGYEVFGEFLQGEVSRVLDFALCAVGEVAVVGEGAEVLVLVISIVLVSFVASRAVRVAYFDHSDLLVLNLEIRFQLVDFGELFLCLCISWLCFCV